MSLVMLCWPSWAQCSNSSCERSVVETWRVGAVVRGGPGARDTCTLCTGHSYGSPSLCGLIEFGVLVSTGSGDSWKQGMLPFVSAYNSSSAN